MPASDRGGNEYALRAGSVTRYPWGESPGEGEANCDGCGSRWDLGQTAPVGSFKPNSFGLYDMQGNVWEWVEDAWHDNYDGAPTDGSGWVQRDPEYRVVRGGSWRNDTSVVRAAVRDKRNIHVRFNTRGFRVARTLSLDHRTRPRPPLGTAAPRPAEPSTSTNRVKDRLGCAVEGRGLGVSRKKFLSIANEVVRFW